MEVGRIWVSEGVSKRRIKGRLKIGKGGGGGRLWIYIVFILFLSFVVSVLKLDM